MLRWMAQRVVHGGRDAWQRVAEQVIARRLRLGLTQAEVADRSGGGVSLPVVQVAEGARQPNDTMALRTARALSRALGWTDDSVERIVAGGEPVDASALAADPVAAELHALVGEVHALRSELHDLAVKIGHQPADVTDR